MRKVLPGERVARETKRENLAVYELHLAATEDRDKRLSPIVVRYL